MRRSHRLHAAILCVLACTAGASLLPLARNTQSEDRNGDRRPDVWRVYDDHGQLSSVTVDTNFDGRADVRKIYAGRVLVRREVDRDFDDRVDLVQEFDLTTGQQARSVVDIDFDGTADLLVLFQNGRPVYQKFRRPITPGAASDSSTVPVHPSAPTADGRLAHLEDPFRADLVVRAVRDAAGVGDWVGLSTSGGLPASSTDVVSPLASASNVLDLPFSHRSFATGIPYSPRGPPVSHLIA